MESLVGLRAEVQRKRQEQLERAAAAVQHPTQRLKIKKSDRVTAGDECIEAGAPNRGVSERDARDKELAEEEKYTADKARCVLEQKAALYDRLHGGVAALENDTLNNTFLVNFQKKIVDNVLESQRRQADKKTASRGIGDKSGKKEDGDDEWVEYVDAFGRTREVRQSEVAALKEQDKYIKEEEENQEETLATAGQGSDETVAAQQEQFEEQFREQQRRRWEQQEELNAMKKDVHYQDVMFDEARTHGPAFVRLSGDTETRREQQTLLRELHASSEAAAAQHKAQQRSRDKSMAHRLDKIRQRKRLKLGLPMTGTFDKLKTPPPSDDEEEEKDANKQVADERSADIPAKRPDAKLREWDVGKQVVGKFIEPSDKDPDAFLLKNPLGGPVELSQEAWLDRQRRDRNEDFAPPSEYQNSVTGGSSRKNKSSSRFGYDRKREGSPFSSLRFSDEDRLQRQYNKDARGNSSSYDITNECEQGYKEAASSSLSSEIDESPNRFITKSKRPGAAIPPPTSFEYYGPPDKKRPRGPLFDPMKKMEEAISKGLKQLKNLT